ncbi:MAG: permease [Bdellovibrionota bacterium]
MSSCCGPKEEESHCSPGPGKKDWWLIGSFSIVAAAYLVHLLHIPLEQINFPQLQNFTHHCYELLNEMWFGIVLGGFAVGVLHYVPQSSIQKLLGNGKNFSGILRATLAGVLLDLCSHGILMVGVKLYNKGMSLGQTMAFLIASPWNSFSLTLILISLIGFSWTMAFIVLSMIIAVVSGVIFNYLVKIGKLPENPASSNLQDENQVEQKSFWQEIPKTPIAFLRDVVWHGIKDSKSIIKWLFIGIILASAIREILSVAQYEEYFGNTGFGLFLTIIFASILEVCSEGSAPIASDIFLRAKSPGNAFAFMMAGVSTDYTEIMVLKDNTKSWKIAFALPLVTLPQVILVAWMIHFL